MDSKSSHPGCEPWAFYLVLLLYSPAWRDLLAFLQAGLSLTPAREVGAASDMSLLTPPPSSLDLLILF